MFSAVTFGAQLWKTDVFPVVLFPLLAPTLENRFVCGRLFSPFGPSSGKTDLFSVVFRTFCAKLWKRGVCFYSLYLSGKQMCFLQSASPVGSSFGKTTLIWVDLLCPTLEDKCVFQCLFHLVRPALKTNKLL